MTLKRRDFINLSAIAAATGIAGIASCTSNIPSNEKTSAMDDLQLMTHDVVPITLQEREARVEKAQRLLREQKMEALILDAGTSLEYFTGISWWPSERTMVAIVPATGTISYVCPALKNRVYANSLK